MLTVKFKSRSYEVQLSRSQLVRPLVQIVDKTDLVTHLLHPLDCLRLGVHNGGYFNSSQSALVHHDSLTAVQKRYLSDWADCLPEYYRQSVKATCAGQVHRNYFRIRASSSYEEWVQNGWMQKSAPEGWFECYTQAVLSNNFLDPAGYKPGTVTDWQTEEKRMLSFVARHSGQIRVNCPGDLSKRIKQRQALLNWASPLAFL